MEPLNELTRMYAHKHTHTRIHAKAYALHTGTHIALAQTQIASTTEQ